MPASASGYNGKVSRLLLGGDISVFKKTVIARLAMLPMASLPIGPVLDDVF